ncbi:MAG: hypothetical protein JNM31_09860 [Flavobacteriales bacterium]|nr:hypothetical protein [Flavobacteriales bacterium]
MRTFHAVLVSALLLSHSKIHAVDYVVPANTNISKFFASLPKDATRVIFSAAAEYKCTGDIVLPDARLLVIDGAGAKLLLGPASNGFTREVADQKEAMARISSRYIIRDFAEIEGGKKAIDLKATLGSVISNLRLSGQTEAAIDLRFCLVTRLENVMVTNPAGRGIVLRQGDWSGASASNSQTNSSVLQQCRVYCARTTTAAFTVLNSGGVRMVDCVSEGAPADYALFLSATTDGDESKPAGNSVVKSFTLENFHVEHAANKASIYVNFPSKATVTLSNVYWNGKHTAPVILYTMGQLNLQDIGWFSPDFRIVSRISAPRINVDRCHSALRMGERNEKGEIATSSDKEAGVLRLGQALPGNTQLKLDYVRVWRPSM